MSYLLEALKKLEEKRQREGVSDLLVVPGEVTREPKKRFLWLYVLSVALLANAVVAVWWMAPWRATARPVTSQPLTEHREPAIPRVNNTPVSVKARTDDQLPTPGRSATDVPLREKPVGALPTGVPQVSAERQARSRLNPQGPESGRAVEPPSVPRTSPRPHAPLDAKPRTDGRVFAIDELPAAVKTGLPELKVSLHSYSPEPRSRLARINDKTLGEGDVVSPGARVEEITPDGVVMSYEGYRFRVGVEQGR